MPNYPCSLHYLEFVPRSEGRPCVKRVRVPELLGRGELWDYTDRFDTDDGAGNRKLGGVQNPSIGTDNQEDLI